MLCILRKNTNEKKTNFFKKWGIALTYYWSVVNNHNVIFFQEFRSAKTIFLFDLFDCMFYY